MLRIDLKLTNAHVWHQEFCWGNTRKSSNLPEVVEEEPRFWLWLRKPKPGDTKGQREWQSYQCCSIPFWIASNWDGVVLGSGGGVIKICVPWSQEVDLGKEPLPFAVVFSSVMTQFGSQLVAVMVAWAPWSLNYTHKLTVDLSND